MRRAPWQAGPRLGWVRPGASPRRREDGGSPRRAPASRVVALLGAGTLAAAALGTGVTIANARPARQTVPQAGTRLALLAIDVEIGAEGGVRVLERRVAALEGGAGAASRGVARVDLAGIAGARLLEVGEVGRPYVAGGAAAPYRYASERRGDELLVTWHLGRVGGAQRELVLDLLLEGALDAGTAEDRFAWRPLLPDHPPIDLAVVSLSVPEVVPALGAARAWRAGMDGVETELDLVEVDARSRRLRARDLGPREGLRVELRWPADLVAATPRPLAAEAPGAGDAPGAGGGGSGRPGPAGGVGTREIAVGLVPALLLVGALVAVGAAFGALWTLLAPRRP